MIRVSTQTRDFWIVICVFGFHAQGLMQAISYFLHKKEALQNEMPLVD